MTRVLLLGAYGNGNIGDHYQALSLSRHLTRADPSIRPYAASPARAELYYEFEPGRRLPRSATEDLALINSFDAVIIGGGGLLASPHRPFDNAEWVEGVRVPILLAAVGASEEVAGLCSSLVKKAAAVTGRDDFSVAALKTVRKDVRLLHDPLLADPELNALTMDADGAVAIAPRKEDDGNRELYAALSRDAAEGDKLISLFPEADRESGVLNTFDGVPATLARTMYALTKAIDGSSAVLSERYHGCILALKRGIPCLGLGRAPGRKIKSLYEQLGAPNLALSGSQQRASRRSLLQMLRDEFDAAETRRRLDRIEVNFELELRSLLAHL